MPTKPPRPAPIPAKDALIGAAHAARTRHMQDCALHLAVLAWMGLRKIVNQRGAARLGSHGARRRQAPRRRRPDLRTSA